LFILNKHINQTADYLQTLTVGVVKGTVYDIVVLQARLPGLAGGNVRPTATLHTYGCKTGGPSTFT